MVTVGKPLHYTVVLTLTVLCSQQVGKIILAVLLTLVELGKNCSLLAYSENWLIVN